MFLFFATFYKSTCEEKHHVKILLLTYFFISSNGLYKVFSNTLGAFSGHLRSLSFPSNLILMNYG